MQRLKFGFFVIVVTGVVIALGVVAGLNLRGYQVAKSIRSSLPDFASDVQPVDAQVIHDLSAKAAAGLVKPGWVHVVTEVFNDSEADANASPENETQTPLSYTSDEWLHVNENNLIYESVSLRFAPDGRVIQLTTFRDGLLRDLTLAKQMGKLAPYPFFLDTGFTQEVEQAQQDGWGAFQASAILNGAPTTLFAISESGAALLPVTGSNAEPEVAETLIYAYYDSLTGRLIQKDKVVKRVDGTKQVIQRFKPTLSEWVESPPSTVLDYLQQEIGN